MANEPAKPPQQHVSVPVTKEDLKVLEDLVDGSPFPQDAILRVALRIGMMAIQKNPNVILPFLGKKQG